MGHEMNNQKRGVGKPKGAKKISQAERDAILTGIANGASLTQIAAYLGRGRATVFNTVAKMRRDGTDGQGLLPVMVVQIEGATDDRAQ